MRTIESPSVPEVAQNDELLGVWYTPALGLKHVVAAQPPVLSHTVSRANASPLISVTMTEPGVVVCPMNTCVLSIAIAVMSAPRPVLSVIQPGV